MPSTLFVSHAPASRGLDAFVAPPLRPSASRLSPPGAAARPDGTGRTDGADDSTAQRERTAPDPVRKHGVQAWMDGALRLRARLASRAPERGVTLVEVLIVVAIIAMVAGGVAFYALPRFKESQIKTAETGARVIRQAVQSWQMSTGESSCPTVSQLVQEKQLDPGANTNDPWGQAYILNCTDDDIIVTSTGPDKKKGSKDDIVVPKGAQVTE